MLYTYIYACDMHLFDKYFITIIGNNKIQEKHI